ncbi:MAG: hypothetical protein J0M28_11985 [Thauera sp.]|nr:hypothetical protein [Thauera sp.]
MSRKLFYDLYRQLSAAQHDIAVAQQSINSLATLWRERKQSADLQDDLLAEANNCLHVLSNSSALFTAAITKWLIDDDVELAKALLHTANVQHLQQPAAESYDLSAVDESTAILVGCRLCALNATPSISLGWTLSLAVSYPGSLNARHAAHYLLRYHVEEFPWTTRRLLKSAESPFKSLEAANSALAELVELEGWLDGSPRLREFAMTPEMRLTLSGLKRNESRDIERYAKMSSLFSQIFTTQHFKYANRTAVELGIGDQVHETSLEMAPYSASVELPHSEQTDPVVGADRRRSLWRGIPQ